MIEILEQEAEIDVPVNDADDSPELHQSLPDKPSNIWTDQQRQARSTEILMEG